MCKTCVCQSSAVGSATWTTCWQSSWGAGAGRACFPSRSAVEAGRAHRRQVPPDRHPDQQLPQRRSAPHLCPHAVQLGEPQHAHREDLQVRRVLVGFVTVLAAEQTEREATGSRARPTRSARACATCTDRPRCDGAVGRPALQHGLPRMLRTHRETAPRRPWPSFPWPEEQASGFGILKIDSTGRIVHFEEKPGARATPPWIPRSPATAPASSPRWASTSSGARSLEEAVADPQPGRLRPSRHPPRRPGPARAGACLRGYWEDVGTIASYFQGQPGAVPVDSAL